MNPTKDVEAELAKEATNAVRKMLAETSTEGPTSFLDSCLAIELAFRHLESTGVFCVDFSLEFVNNSVEVTVTAASVTRPEKFDLDGLREIIFMVCMPKHALTKDVVLLVRRATFEHSKDPTVQYKVKNESTPPRRD